MAVGFRGGALAALVLALQAAPALADGFVPAIVFDNGGYISTGKLPAVGSLSSQGVDIAEVARAFGMTDVVTVSDVAAFACPCRKSNPDILVVEPSKNWATKNASGPFHSARDRRVLLQG